MNTLAPTLTKRSAYIPIQNSRTQLPATNEPDGVTSGQRVDTLRTGSEVSPTTNPFNQQ
jgi:hypothetical protein